MSIDSYANITAIYPKDTETHFVSWITPTIVDEGDGNLSVGFDSEEGCYCECLLEDIVKFFGRPLDEVDGLNLCVEYRCYDDLYECKLNLVDGKWTFLESVMVERDLSHCPIEIDCGTPQWRIRKATEVWTELEKVCVDDDGLTDSGCYVDVLGWYPKGVDREDIWRDLEDKYGVSVAYLMGQSDDPFGDRE